MRQALDTEALQWVVRLTSGEATVADARALKEWCARSPAHAHAFAEANGLWDAAGTAAIRRPVAATIGVRVNPSRRWFVGGAIAASVIGAGYAALRPPLDLWPSPRELAADYRTRTAERREIAMGDGVTVELNTRSSLNVVADAHERQIELISGEAAISVSPTTPVAVAVRAGGGTVHAANAQFNLRCDGGRSVVTCHRGTIAIDCSGRKIDLAADHQVAYADGAVQPVVNVDPAVVMAWRDGQLLFRQTPLADVVSEANRYRNGRIVLMNEALGRRPVDARIPIARIDDLIALVREAYGAKVTTLPGAIVVLS